MKQTFTTCVIWLVAILSTTYILITGWYNVPSLDDYGFIVSVENYGLWHLIKTMYLTWQCRFSTFFVNGLIWIIFGRAGNLIGVTIIMLCAGWLSVALLLKGMATHYKWQVPIPMRWQLAILTTNVGIMAFIEPSTFYWLCALNYTIAIWATIFLVYFIFYSTAPQWVTWIGAIVSSLYISGSAENYAPLVILVLGIILLIRFVQHKNWKWWKNDTNHILFVSLIVLFVGFLVMLFGPGNKVRLASDGGSSEIIGNMQLSSLIVRTIKASVILGFRFVSRSLYYIALLPLFIWWGSHIKHTTNYKAFSWREFSVLSVGLILFIVISVAVCVFGVSWHWYAPPRAYCFMSFVIVAIVAYIGIRIGMTLNKDKYSALLSLSSSVLLIVFFCYCLITDVPVLKDYNHYVVSRNQQIEKLAGLSTPLEKPTSFICEPYCHHWNSTTYATMRNFVYKCLGKTRRFYEPQVLLMVSELSENPSDFKNRGLQEYYHADFNIVCYPCNDNNQE